MPQAVINGNVPIHLVLDFDGTITEEDTISILAEIAISHHPSPATAQQKWHEILKAYSQDLSTHKHNFPSQTPGTLIRSPQEEACLASLKNVEHRSIDRVNSSGVFQGLTPEILSQAASESILSKKVRVRDGLKELIETVRGGGGTVGIVSVNWSSHWIAAVLETSGIQVGCNEDGDEIIIMANQIDAITGQILGPNRELGWPIPLPTPSETPRMEPEKTLNLLTTSPDKLNALQILQLRTQYHPIISRDTETETDNVPEQNRTPTSQQRTRTRLVYIGDSSTDIECLTIADLGIVMVSSSTPALKTELERLGYGWKFVGELKSDWGKEMDRGILGDDGVGVVRREKVVYWAEGFEGLGRVLGG